MNFWNFWFFRISTKFNRFSKFLYFATCLLKSSIPHGDSQGWEDSNGTKLFEKIPGNFSTFAKIVKITFLKNRKIRNLENLNRNRLRHFNVFNEIANRRATRDHEHHLLYWFCKPRSIESVSEISIWFWSDLFENRLILWYGGASISFFCIMFGFIFFREDAC